MRKIKSKLLKTTIIFFLFIIIANTVIIYADDIDEEEIDITQECNSQEVNTNNEPIINSRRYIIYDRNAKSVVYGKNENVKSAMASTTKIMTAIVVLENCDNLNKTITINKKAANTGGSRLGLKNNDKITIHDLLYGLLLKSGNDAAVALAIEVGSSLEEFANLMNKKVTDLGLSNTNFVTPHGLDNPMHYTTAYELAKITDYALNNKTFCKIVGTKEYTITINNYPKQIRNTNELLGTIQGVVGVKTGFTNNAGRCLITETKRNGKDIIVIVLGADTAKHRAKDSIKLIEYAFSNYIEVNIKQEAIERFENWKNINKCRIKIKKAKYNNIQIDLANFTKEKILVDKHKTTDIIYEFNSLTNFEAPLEKGQKIGELIIKNKEQIIENIDIICKQEVEKKSVWDFFKENLNISHLIYIKNPILH